MSNDENAGIAGNTGTWPQIILIYALCVLGAATISQAVPVIGDIARLFHPTRQVAGYIISIPSALVALGALLAGFAVDRIGDKPILLFGSLTVIVGDLGVAFSNTLGELLLMRAIEGLGYVAIAVGTVTMVARTTSGPRRNSALALWSSFVPMSFAIPLLLARQMAGTGQWRWAFLGHAIAIAVLAALAAATLPAAPKAASAIRTGGLNRVLRTPAIYFMGLAFAAAAFVQTGVVSTLPEQFGARYGIPVGLAAGIGTLGMVINMLGSLSTGPMLNRGIGTALSIGVTAVIIAAIAACGVFLPLQSFALTLAASLVFFLSAGVVVGLWALMPTIAPSPQSIGATSGLVTQLTLWGVLFGPPAAFGALGGGGWSHMVTNILVAMGACLVLLVPAVRRGAGSTIGTSAQPAVHPTR